MGAALVFLAAFLVYANSINPVFHWEDVDIVSENVHIRTLKNLPVFFRPGYVNVYEAGQGTRYRPLRSVTLALDYALWQNDARGYHLTNVLLHCLTAVLVWLFCLLVSGDPVLAFVAGLLFAVHPAHAESVAWIKNRSDILCALFYFASAAAYAAFLRGLAPGRKAGAALCVLSAALLVPAFLAKEMALSAPFVLTLLLLYLNDKEGKPVLDGWYSLVPHYALLLVYLLFREKSMGGGGGFPGGLPAHALFAAATAGKYLEILVWPVRLSIERAVPAGTAGVLAALIALAAASAVPALYALKKREGAFWLAAFFALAVPVLNIIYIPGRPLAEQRLYLPSAAFCAFLAWGAVLFMRGGAGKIRRAAGIAAVAAAALLLGGRTVYRNLDWKSEVLLWEKTIASSPSPRAYNNLAVAFLNEKRYGEAVNAAELSLKADPAFVDAYNTLGAAYHDLGLYDKSITAFERAVFFSSGRAYKSLMNLAALYSLTGRWQEALSVYGQVIGAAPWLDAAYYNMGLTLAEHGRGDEALRAFREALSLNPYNALAYVMMGRVYAAKKNAPAAEAAYKEALKLEPSNSEASAYLFRRKRHP